MSQIHVSGHGGGGWIGIVSGVRGSQSGWEGRISVERETASERERERESLRAASTEATTTTSRLAIDAAAGSRIEEMCEM